MTSTEISSYYIRWKKNACVNGSASLFLLFLCSGFLSVQKMKQLKMKVSDAKLKVLQHLSLVELDRKGHIRLVMWGGSTTGDFWQGGCCHSVCWVCWIRCSSTCSTWTGLRRVSLLKDQTTEALGSRPPDVCVSHIFSPNAIYGCSISSLSNANRNAIFLPFQVIVVYSNCCHCHLPVIPTCSSSMTHLGCCLTGCGVALAGDTFRKCSAPSILYVGLAIEPQSCFGTDQKVFLE